MSGDSANYKGVSAVISYIFLAIRFLSRIDHSTKRAFGRIQRSNEEDAVGQRGLNLPNPTPSCHRARRISYQISSRRFGQPVSGLYRITLFQHAKRSLGSISTKTVTLALRGRKNGQTKPSRQPPFPRPPHTLLRLSLEGKLSFTPLLHDVSLRSWVESPQTSLKRTEEEPHDGNCREQP